MKYLSRLSILMIVGGIFYSCDTNPTAPTFQFEEPEHIVKNIFVQSLTFDNEGNAWIGSLKQGLYKVDDKVVHFNSSNSNLPDSFMIPSMQADKLGNMWIGSNIGLIKHKDDKFQIFDSSNSPINYNIYSLAVDHNNSIWFTNGDIYNGGVIKYDNQNWKLFSPDNSNLPSTVIHDIAVDNENNIWFTSFGTVAKFNNNEWSFYNSNSSGVNLDWVDKITFENDKSMWLSCDNSLSSASSIMGDFPNLLKFEKNKWSAIESPKKNNETHILTDIYGDSKKRIWLALGGELIYHYSGKWYECCKLQTTIFDIQEKSTNQIWLGTANGVYVLKTP
ncbi:MAG: hypothetical protein JXI43_03225 [Tissierellales bacterium]|nr:hypothetical protein [Tissierellales bacterium]